MTRAAAPRTVMLADAIGEMIGSAPRYVLSIPPQAVGANKTHADLFNAADSGLNLRVVSASAYADNSVAVTGVLGARISLTRTGDVGTGGTAASAEGTDATAPTVARLNPASAALPASVTARASPTGGATGGSVISSRNVFTEETNAGVSVIGAMGAQLVPNGPPVVVPPGTGLRFLQGAVATVGNIGFEIVFEAVTP
jgi:hypothetical protein